MGKGVAVVLTEGALGGGADVAKDEAGRRLGRNALEVGAVPCGDGRGEEAGRRAELGVCVEAYAEAIGVVLPAPGVLGQGRQAVSAGRPRVCMVKKGRAYEPQARVEGLLEDGVGRIEDELGQ